jgi:four helix bundle protein
MMDKQELERRTKRFAVRVIKFVGGFNSSASGRVVGHQLLKSGTSIGANYREANRAVSRRDFVHKISIAEKEASESVYWLEICSETSLGNSGDCIELEAEANELLAIFTSIGRSVRANDRRADNIKGTQVSEEGQIEYGSEGFEEDIDDLLPQTMRIENGH